MRSLPLMLVLAACTSPAALDAGGAETDAGAGDAGVDAGPWIDPSRPGVVALVEECTIPPSPPDAAIELELDIEYSRADGEVLRLDVARPLEAGPHPLVVMIHGGAWTLGDKSDERPRDFIRRLASIGYVAASVNYRHATIEGDNLFPAAVEDTRCATRWLRANAARFDADPSRTVAVGASAGGHLALMLGLAADAGDLDGRCELSDPIELRGVMSYYGPADLRPAEDPDMLLELLVTTFLGGTPSERPDEARRASPITYVDAADPPPLLLQGSSDSLVPPDQARSLQSALEGVGVESVYVEVDNGAHAFSLITEQERYRRTSCTALAYLEAVLAP